MVNIHETWVFQASTLFYVLAEKDSFSNLNFTKKKFCVNCLQTWRGIQTWRNKKLLIINAVELNGAEIVFTAAEFFF